MKKIKKEEGKITFGDNKTIKLSKWFQVSVFHEDNMRYQSSYVPEYLGMIKTLDAMCWATDIQTIEIAKTIFDAIKIKYFPKWLLEKFPAKISVIDISLLYPQVSKNVDKISFKDFNKSQKYINVKCDTKHFDGIIY